MRKLCGDEREEEIDERKFGKIMAGWWRCWHAIRKLQPIIPDSQGQVSSDKLNYRVCFIIKHLTPFSWTFTVFLYLVSCCI